MYRRPPVICSGAMYRGVPRTPLAVVSVPSKIFATPKSVTLRSPSEANIMLSGLMSRCSTLWACAASRAAAAARPNAQTASGDIGPTADR